MSRPAARPAHAGHCEAAPVLARLLEAGTPVRLPVRGRCMRPAVREGDRALVARFDAEPRPGQIVLARVGCRLVLHRLVGIDTLGARCRYRLQGDAGSTSQAVLSREDLLGQLVAVERAGRLIQVDRRATALRLQLRRVAFRRGASRLARRAA
ncbi:MAG: S24/S26 family peptidase, partial [Planctomycetota bacterium]